MRDTYKLVLIIPVVIVLAAVLFKMQGGDIDLTAGPGIIITGQGEDFVIEAPGSVALQFSDQVLPAQPAEPTLSITHDPTIDVDLRLLGSGESAQYHFEVDVPALQTAVGAAITTQVWNPLHQDPGGISNPGYFPLDELRIEEAAPIRVTTQFDDTEDRMVYTVGIGGGTAGEILTSGGAAAPTWLPAPTGLPAPGTDGQVLTWNGNGSPPAPIWEDPTGGSGGSGAAPWTFGFGFVDNNGDEHDTSTLTVRSSHVHVGWPDSQADTYEPYFDLPAGGAVVRIIDDASGDVTSAFTRTGQRWQSADYAGFVTLLTIVTTGLYEAGSAAASTRTEVTVSAAQIRTLDTTPVDLIAAPGAGKYLMIEQAWLVKSGTEAAVETPACPGTSPRTPTAGCIANSSISVMFVSNQVTPNQPFHIYTDSISRVFLSGFYNADNVLSDEEYNYGEKIGGHGLYANTALQLGVWYNFPLSDNWTETAWAAFTASLTSATFFKFVIFYQVHDVPDLS